MQASDPLLIRAQARKGGTVISRHEPVGLLQTRHTQAALQQGEGQHFGVSKGRHAMWRLPPVQQVRMGGQKIIDKGIEFRQLIDYARQRSRPRWQEEFGHATLLYSGQLGTALCPLTQDWGLSITMKQRVLWNGCRNAPRKSR